MLKRNQTPSRSSVTSKASTGAKLPWVEVFAHKDFYYPAGFGLLLLAGAIYKDSPFLWVLAFLYALAFLPALVLYVRNRPRPPQPLDEAFAVEPDVSEHVRAILQRLSHSLNIDESLLARAQQHYSRLEGIRRAVVRRAGEAHELSPELGAQAAVIGERIHLLALEPLRETTDLFLKLEAIPAQQLIKDLQSLPGGPALEKRKAVASEREALMSSALDRLDACARILDAFTQVVQVSPRPEALVKGLESLEARIQARKWRK